MNKTNVITAYVDGSFYPQYSFAGAGVYFPEYAQYNLEQYVPRDNTWGELSALRAEMYAALLAARRVLLFRVQTLIIKQDCKEAIYILSNINNKTSLDIVKQHDSILMNWWKVRQYVDVQFKYVQIHQVCPEKDSNDGNMLYTDWYGNDQADKMAKRAANLTRYQTEVQKMDERNPLNVCPFLFCNAIGMKPLIGTWYEKQNKSEEERRLSQCMDHLEQMTPVTSKWKAIAQLNREIIEKMWAYPYIRQRLIQNHHPALPLFEQLN